MSLTRFFYGGFQLVKIEASATFKNQLDVKRPDCTV
jgi:hypothetical protein